MRAVAERAGVSAETVYKSFGGKPGMVKALWDITLAGDDEPVPMADRPQVREILRTRELGAKLRLYAAYARGIHERIATLFALLTQAGSGGGSGPPGGRRLGPDRPTVVHPDHNRTGLVRRHVRGMAGRHAHCHAPAPAASEAVSAHRIRYEEGRRGRSLGKAGRRSTSTSGVDPPTALLADVWSIKWTPRP